MGRKEGRKRMRRRGCRKRAEDCVDKRSEGIMCGRDTGSEGGISKGGKRA